MLKRFRVNNFRKLMNFEFHPQGINLLIGPNNSGKTSLCLAMRFLSLSAVMALNDAVSSCSLEPWNIMNVYFDSDIVEFEMDAIIGGSEEEKISFHYELRMKGPKGFLQMGNGLEVISEKLTADGSGFSNTELLWNSSGKVKLLHEGRFKRGLTADRTIETSAPTDKTMLNLLYDLETNRTANMFKKYLWTWAYYALDPYQMREPRARPMERTLTVNGANLSSVLHSLHNERPEVEKHLLEMVKKVEPQMNQLSFIMPDQEHAYMFNVDGKGNRFGVTSISDGTFRYLAMAYVILSLRKQKGFMFSPLAMIEEPENGVFVSCLKPLFKQLEPSGEDGQFIFTTHNPYFIDLFDSVPEGIHVFKSDGYTSSINRPDQEKLLKKLEEFPLGELHSRGLLV